MAEIGFGAMMRICKYYHPQNPHNLNDDSGWCEATEWADCSEQRCPYYEALVGTNECKKWPAVSEGKWKRRIVDGGFNADWICSECGYRVKYDFCNFNFCPNCGAEMR